MSTTLDYRITKGGKTVARFDSLYDARLFVDHKMTLGEWGADWGPKILIISRNGVSLPTLAELRITFSKFDPA